MTHASTSGAHETERAPITGPFAAYDLPFETARLRAAAEYGSEGHSGRTLAKYRDLRVVLEAMRSGRRLPIHETEERLTLQVLVGQIRVWLDTGASRDLVEGAFAAIDAARVHEIECLEECAFVLTLAWPPAVNG